MSGNGLGNQQRIMLARLNRLGSVATFEQLYWAGLLTRKAVRKVLITLEKRDLVKRDVTDDRYWITDTGRAAHGALP